MFLVVDNLALFYENNRDVKIHTTTWAHTNTDTHAVFSLMSPIPWTHIHIPYIIYALLFARLIFHKVLIKIFTIFAKLPRLILEVPARH